MLRRLSRGLLHLPGRRFAATKRKPAIGEGPASEGNKGNDEESGQPNTGNRLWTAGFFRKHDSEHPIGASVLLFGGAENEQGKRLIFMLLLLYLIVVGITASLSSRTSSRFFRGSGRVQQAK